MKNNESEINANMKEFHYSENEFDYNSIIKITNFGTWKTKLKIHILRNEQPQELTNEENYFYGDG